jgi:hypothetical protein
LSKAADVDGRLFLLYRYRYEYSAHTMAIPPPEEPLDRASSKHSAAIGRMGGGRTGCADWTARIRMSDGSERADGCWPERLSSPGVFSRTSQKLQVISVEEVIQNELRILFLENRTMEFFLNPPSCSTMKGVSVVVVLSTTHKQFFCKESAMVAFIFP